MRSTIDITRIYQVTKFFSKLEAQMKAGAEEIFAFRPGRFICKISRAPKMD